MKNKKKKYGKKKKNYRWNKATNGKFKTKKRKKNFKRKTEDLNYIDDFKKKLALLEESEKNEMMDKKQKERDLAEYRRLQTEEKKWIALRDFGQLNEDTYKQLKRLEMEDDDFMKYTEYLISENKKLHLCYWN